MMKVTLKQLAEKLNCDISTISRVLNNKPNRVSKEKAALIKKLAEEMNFQPDNSAQMLAGKSSKIIGVLIDSYAPQVRFKTLSVAEKILAKEGFRLIIGQTHDNYKNFKSYIADFVSRRADAIICFSHEYPDFDISKDFDSFKNVVFVGRPQLENASFVEHDIEKGIQKLVKHLHETNRKRIGYFMLNSNSLVNKQRIQGYRQGLKDQGVEFDESLIFNCSYEPDKEDYFHAIDYLVKQQHVDAIIANNDIWAVMLIKYLKQCDIKVPQDVAVTGFDNIDIAEISDPEVTTIDPKSEEQGKIIAEMILEMVQNKKKNIPQQITIEPELVIRESTYIRELTCKKGDNRTRQKLMNKKDISSSRRNSHISRPVSV